MSRHRCFSPAITVAALVVAIGVIVGTPPASALDVGEMWGRTATTRSTEDMVFRGAAQYAKLVLHEADGVNDHPVSLKQADLVQVLRRLRLQVKADVDSAPDNELFTDGEAALLGEMLSRGLARATARQDLVFVVSGRHGRGPFSQQAFTSGRAFFAHNRLHLILGEVHRTDAQWEAQRKANLAVGCGACPIDSSAASVPLPTRAVASRVQQRVVAIEGLEFMTLNGDLRADWVILDIERLLGATTGGDESRGKSDGYPSAQTSSRYETARVAQERRERGDTLGHFELRPEGVPREAVRQTLTQ